MWKICKILTKDGDHTVSKVLEDIMIMIIESQETKIEVESHGGAQ